MQTGQFAMSQLIHKDINTPLPATLIAVSPFFLSFLFNVFAYLFIYSMKILRVR